MFATDLVYALCIVAILVLGTIGMRMHYDGALRRMRNQVRMRMAEFADELGTLQDENEKLGGEVASKEALAEQLEHSLRQGDTEGP